MYNYYVSLFNERPTDIDGRTNRDKNYSFTEFQFDPLENTWWDERTSLKKVPGRLMSVVAVAIVVALVAERDVVAEWGLS